MNREGHQRARKASTTGHITRRTFAQGAAAIGAAAPIAGMGLTPRGAFAHRQDDGGPLACSTEDVELLYMTHSHPPADAVNEQLIAEFQEMYPNVTITHDASPHATYEQKLLTAFAGGEGPDIFWAGDWLVPQFMETNILDTVQPEAYGVSSQQEFIDLYEEGSLAVFIDESEDEPQVVSAGLSEYNTFSVVYHPSHFEEAGIELPSSTEPMTWAQFADIAEQLTVMDGETRVRSGFEWNYPAGPNWTVLHLQPMLHQLGAELVDPETGEANFATPEMQQVMEYAQDLRNRNVTDPAFVVAYADDFANERISMMISGPWALPAVANLNPEAEVAVAPLPVFEGGERSTVLYSWSWFVNRNTSDDKKCWAWTFASFLTSKAQQWWDESGYIQPRTDITVDGESLAEYRVGTLPGLDVFLEDFPHGQYQFRSTRFSQIADVWNRAFQRILEGEDVQSVLESTSV